VVGVKLLIGLAALVVLFVVACDVEFTSNLTTEFPAAGSSPGMSAGPVVVGDVVELPEAAVGRDLVGVAEGAAVRDVVGVAEAAANSEAAKGARAVFVLLAEASNGANVGGEKLIRLRMPALITEFKSELAAARARIARVPVGTATGRACRQSVIAMIDRQRGLFTTLASDVRSGRAVSKAVNRFSSAQTELSRWYTAEINRCSLRATPAEKAAIAQAMRSF
jgi:hypothetical protein